MGWSSGQQTFAVVGQGSFALRCARMLLERDALRPALLASPDGSLAALAAQLDVPHATSRRSLTDALRGASVDWLFSLNNPWILTPEILAQVTDTAVNYHDGPLPAYAGLSATTWAILQGEGTHGITFHAVVPEIDAGPILLQRSVPIARGERTFSLNAKCFSAGMAAFGELLRAMDAGPIPTRPQQGERSYFGRSHRPPSGGWLDPRLPAAVLERMVRALDHGPTPNPVGSARLLAGEEVVVVRDARLEAGSGWPLAVADGTVWLDAIERLDGTPIDPSALPDPAPPDLEALDRWIALDARWAPHEAFWLRRLQQPSFRHPMARDAADPTAHASPALRDALAALARALSASVREAGTLAMAVYGSRLGAADAGGRAIGFRGPGQADARGRVYAPTVPLRALHALDEPPAAALSRLRRDLERVAARGTFALDASRRQQARAMPVPAPEVDVRWTADAVAPAALTLDLADPERPALRSNGACAEAVLERIATHLVALAGDLGQQLDRPIGQASLVPLGERHAVDACRGPALELGKAMLPQRVDEALAARGDERALVSEARSMSAAEVRRRVNRAAGALVARGVSPGGFVAVAARSPLDQVLALLAVLRAGAAYVPIDPELPRKRAETILEDAQPVLAIGEGGVPLAALAGADTDVELPCTRPTDPAYAIFTSGSTGRPKGVRVSHANLASQLDARLEGYAERPSGLATLHSLSFDSAIAGLFWALVTGAPLVVAGERTRRDPHAVRELLRAHRPSHLDVPPSLWGEVLSIASDADLASLRAVVVGGEACPPPVARAHLERLPRAGLYNEYGPTEATVYSTVHRVQAPVRGPIPIGRPIANAHCVVAEPSGRALPLDLPGELWIGGPGVAMGYVNRPSLEAERFVEREGERFYRTGDRVRLGGDGLLRIAGRLDQQVQVHGHRVELDEVEEALTALPEVVRAVVTPRERHGTTEIVAHIVPVVGAKVCAPTLREALARELPAPMIPTAMGTIETIPLTPAGKVDHAALPEIGAVAAVGAAPESEVERWVAAIVAEELGLPRVGVDADFFDLGGNSLVAMRVIRRINERAPGAGLRVVDIYRGSTVAKLAERVEHPAPAAVAGDAERFLIPIQPGRRDLTPLFGVHVLGEGASLYRPLARELGAERPVYGLASPVPASAQGDHPTDVERLAELYLEALFSRQPEGPFCLAAVSLASVVAWEMASRLRRRGHEVELLTLFDSLGPEPPRTSVGAKLREHGRRLREHGFDHVRSRLSRRAERLRERWRDAQVDVARRLGRVPGDLRVQLVMKQNVEGALAYEIRPIDVDLLIFRATEDAFHERAYVEAGLGWGSYARSVSVVDVDGTHLGILAPPGVRTLAAELKRRLTALDG